MTHTVARRQIPRLRSLVAALLAGPIIWSIYHIVAYVLMEVACRTPLLAGEVAGYATVSLVVVVLGVFCVILIAAFGVFSYLRFRRIDRQGAGGEDPDRAESAARFLALSAVLLSVLFALLVVLAAVPALFLSPCVTQ